MQWNFWLWRSFVCSKWEKWNANKVINIWESDDRILNVENYIEDFSQLPINLVYVFEIISDKVDILNELITKWIQSHAPLRRVKITRPSVSIVSLL